MLKKFMPPDLLAPWLRVAGSTSVVGFVWRLAAGSRFEREGEQLAAGAAGSSRVAEGVSWCWIERDEASSAGSRGMGHAATDEPLPSLVLTARDCRPWSSTRRRPW